MKINERKQILEDEIYNCIRRFKEDMNIDCSVYIKVKNADFITKSDPFKVFNTLVEVKVKVII